jgi:hypothetical protein
MGDADGGAAGEDMCLHTPVVLRLLGGSAVIAPAVGLHDEVEIRPVEIDAPAKLHLGLRQRQARAADDPKKPALELGLGEAEGVAVEDSPERRDAPLTLAPVELGPEGVGIGELEDAGFVDRASRAVGARVVARSMRVREGVVIGMPRWVVTSASASEGRRWIRSPAVCRTTSACRETSIGIVGTGCHLLSLRIRQSSAAEMWLRHARGPTARTAAIHWPSVVSSGRPTA